MRYYITARAKTPTSVKIANSVSNLTFRVSGNVIEEEISKHKEPKQFGNHKTYSSVLQSNSGTIDVTGSIPRRYALAGESIQLMLDIYNNSSCTVTGITVLLACVVHKNDTSREVIKFSNALDFSNPVSNGETLQYVVDVLVPEDAVASVIGELWTRTYRVC